MKPKQQMFKKSVLNGDQTAQAGTEASLDMLITVVSQQLNCGVPPAQSLHTPF